jgi:hypothetical protein
MRARLNLNNEISTNNKLRPNTSLATRRKNDFESTKIRANEIFESMRGTKKLLSGVTRIPTTNYFDDFK